MVIFNKADASAHTFGTEAGSLYLGKNPKISFDFGSFLSGK